MTVTMKNTKKEILDAYESTLNELVQLKKVKKENNTSSNKQEIKKEVKQEREIPKSLNDISTIDDIMKNMFDLKSQFSKSSNLLQEKLTTEATSLKEINDEVVEYTQNLQDLHEIEVNDESLKTLMETYIETEQRQQDALEEKNKALEEEMSALRLDWDKEYTEHSQTFKELKNEAKKQNDRENKEYQYLKKQKENADKDLFSEEQKCYESELAEIKERKDQEWLEKEESIGKKEEEAQKLEEEANEIESKLEKEIKKASEEGAGIAKRDTKNKMLLLSKDYEGKERLFSLKINGLKENIAKQNFQIEQLSNKLSTALKQAQDLAIKALEGTSNTNSFEAMKEIALEQAKNSSKGK